MMIDFEKALRIAENNAPDGLFVCIDDYGEIPSKYVFNLQTQNGEIPPWGGHMTVDKESGECKFEYLEREGNAPYSPIRGYKEIKL